MKIFYTLLFLLPTIILSQVKVKGYTKKDGTYVQPHLRTSPDNTKINNYSYPGNYNPNKDGNILYTPSSIYNSYYSTESDHIDSRQYSIWKWILYIGLTVLIGVGLYYSGLEL